MSSSTARTPGSFMWSEQSPYRIVRALPVGAKTLGWFAAADGRRGAAAEGAAVEGRGDGVGLLSGTTLLIMATQADCLPRQLSTVSVDSVPMQLLLEKKTRTTHLL